LLDVRCKKCGAPIRKVEDWLLELTPKDWECQKCFFKDRKEPKGDPIPDIVTVSDIVGDISDLQIVV
jgi:hypothetical protein